MFVCFPISTQRRNAMKAIRLVSFSSEMGPIIILQSCSGSNDEDVQESTVPPNMSFLYPEQKESNNPASMNIDLTLIAFSKCYSLLTLERDHQFAPREATAIHKPSIGPWSTVLHDL